MITLAPSSTRDVQVTAPTISFADIGGLTKVKEELKEMVSAPVKYRHYYADIGVEPPRGALMYGPPGVGKTMLAKAMANECSANFISIKGPQLMTKWFGETEQVRSLLCSLLCSLSLSLSLYSVNCALFVVAAAHPATPSLSLLLPPPSPPPKERTRGV